MTDELPDRAELYIKVAVGAAGAGNRRCGVGTKQRSVVEAWSWVSTTHGEAEGLSETGQVGQWVAQG
jgi:hypothetical protein